MTDFLKMLLVDFWATIAEMSPYLLFGFFVAGLISVFISQQTVEKHLGKRSLGSLVKASVVGVPLPLCSCGVIPVAMSLRKHGASKGAVISFLLSTPQTGVDSIFVTLSLLGPLFAIFRPLAAFVVGIFGGGLVDMVETEDDQAVPQCHEQCCDPSTEGKKINLKQVLNMVLLHCLLISAERCCWVFWLQHLFLLLFRMVTLRKSLGQVSSQW